MTKTDVTKNPYSHFFQKLLLLVGIVFLFDFSIGSLLRYFYFNQKSGVQYRTTYSFEKTNEDILIFGSSRATHHYIPALFENKFGYSAYNVGKDGELIFYHYCVLQSVLKRYTPKMIILDFHNSDLQNDKRGYDELSTLLPYYNTHPEVREIANLKSPFEKWKLCSFIYPFNSSIFTIAAGNTEFNKKRRGDEKGYLPIYKVCNNPIEHGFKMKVANIDSMKKKFFESFIKDCVDRNIKLYVLKSPTYIEQIETDPYVVEARKITAKYNVPFWDYSNDAVFIGDNGTYFADRTHMNNAGAELFTETVINRIASSGK